MTKKTKRKKKKPLKKEKKTIRKKKEKIQKKEEIKELKDEKEESELEEITEEFGENINENRFTEFLQTNVKAPVLERVAIAGDLTNLEQELAIVQAQQSQDTIEETGIDYGTKSDYISTGITNQRGRNGVQYTGPPVDYSILEQEGGEETRRFVGKGDMPQRRERRDRVEIEKQVFVEEDKDTKKYLSKGDYK